MPIELTYSLLWTSFGIKDQLRWQALTFPLLDKRILWLYAALRYVGLRLDPSIAHNIIMTLVRLLNCLHFAGISQISIGVSLD